MRSGRRGRQIGTKVELGPKEDDPEEQCQNADAMIPRLHVVTKTKLRWERLRGQACKPFSCLHLHTVLGYSIEARLHGAHSQR